MLLQKLRENKRRTEREMEANLIIFLELCLKYINYRSLACCTITVSDLAPFVFAMSHLFPTFPTEDSVFIAFEGMRSYQARASLMPRFLKCYQTVSEPTNNPSLLVQ